MSEGTPGEIVLSLGADLVGATDVREVGAGLGISRLWMESSAFLTQKWIVDFERDGSTASPKVDKDQPASHKALKRSFNCLFGRELTKSASSAGKGLCRFTYLLYGKYRKRTGIC